MIISRVVGLLGLLSGAVAYKTLSDDGLRNIADPGDDFDIKNGALLAPILQPRVPGTPGSTAVLTHFVNFFQKSLPKWELSFQNSSSKTPLSGNDEVPFRNLIATRDPPWAQQGHVGRLALVAHYDSKIDPPGFIGAIDSAAPCAMLMHAARSLDDALTKKWAAMESDGETELEEAGGIQIILLDGEEAFKVWTHDDSIYGARSLAEEWEQTMHPAASTYRTPLDAIDLFVLLDLLGSAKPTVPSFFRTTHWAYSNMAAAEARLRSLKQLETPPADVFLREANKKETDRWLGGAIEDDHIPFQARGVDILHMIPAPFPAVWHKMTDDGEHLDIPTVKDWAKIVTAFAAEWMELDGYLSPPKKRNAMPELDRTEL
ncbi:glutaminyl-peptide cyclotransferase [Aureobasidium pullulans]|uniref:Peptide hydrolase n=1 Tax=Aureobasidium pullulans TaxID=5580 RepID=A0A4T0C7H3_AURPU|nr:glutaminyl-peptide cyclotransferase [Aureobasidium pullulans]